QFFPSFEVFELETSCTNLHQDLAITARETLGKPRPDHRKGGQPGREHRVSTIVRDPSQYLPPYILRYGLPLATDTVSKLKSNSTPIKFCSLSFARCCHIATRDCFVMGSAFYSQPQAFALKSVSQTSLLAPDLSPFSMISDIVYIHTEHTTHDKTNKISRRRCQSTTLYIPLKSTTALLARAAVRKAILEAEAAALERLYAIQEEELRLQQRKKQLELPTSIAKAEAEERAYAIAEPEEQNQLNPVYSTTRSHERQYANIRGSLYYCPADIADFVERRAQVANHPIFGKITSDAKRTDPPSNKRKSHHNVKNYATEEFRKICSSNFATNDYNCMSTDFCTSFEVLTDIQCHIQFSPLKILKKGPSLISESLPPECLRGCLHNRRTLLLTT
ncbi:Hypothetical predicted protein, partial [Paramuricea clavata]